jgi:hypothetical protein
MRSTIIAAIAALSLASCSSTGGGSNPVNAFSAKDAPLHFTAEEAADFSKQIERDLAAKGARLAIVFRSGETRDQLPDGISYTHGAFWVFVPITLDDGRVINGYAVYNLYHGDGKTLAMDKSYLHQDFPIDFTAPSGVDDVAVIIPSPEMQRRILTLMDGPAYTGLHIEPYSLVSNPHDIKYQNCTEFMLDVVAAAAWNTTDMAQLKVNLRKHFKPTVVKTGALERFFAPMMEARIKTDDQGRDIVTATYESMAAFMKANNLLQETYILRRTPSPPPAPKIE